MNQSTLPLGYSSPPPPPAPRGAVYTKHWVVELLLDLAGYVSEANLVDSIAVEPAIGAGAFLVPMAERLVASCIRQNRALLDCQGSIIAYELDQAGAATASAAVLAALLKSAVPKPTAEGLAARWVHVGDYLFDAPRLPRAHFVIGNPPYVRLEEIPSEAAALYRNIYPTMRGRADLYVAFFEAALRQLTENGVCAYICADRWMLNQYGAELRRLVTARFNVETVVEMHDVAAFDEDVSAYPAITVIRRGRQSRAVVASLGSGFASGSGRGLADSLSTVGERPRLPLPIGLTATVLEGWFTGSDPWPCSAPQRLALLRRLEEQFEPLESAATGTRVGIGVATGLDSVFLTKDPRLVEDSRLLKLAMAQDTSTGHFRWSGHYLVNPWDDDGLVDIKQFPLLRAYLEAHQESVKKRNTAQKNPHGWFRTIDRIQMSLSGKPKLYVPDVKERFNPVLDTGEAYPHHNLYFIVSEAWNLEVLGGLLLSSIGQLFIEAYGVRMRGGYLRFQAQYLRRVRVPSPETVTTEQRDKLVKAFRLRDRELADLVARKVYRLTESELPNGDQH